VGTAEYIRAYVRSKCGTICKDVDTMRICSDPLIRYQLFKFCMNTRLSFLSRNVTPENMATSSDDHAHMGPVHVDQKIVKEVLSAATGDTCCTAKTQNQHMLNLCKLSVQSPHHKGGYAITPTAASGLAAFYSATAQFVTLLASLPQGGNWVRGGQDLAAHDTWSNSQLQALTKAHDSLIQDYKCAEWQSQEVLANVARQSQEPDAAGRAAPAVDQVPQVTTPLLIPPLNQLALLSAARAHGENAENAQEGRGSRMPDQRIITRQIMREWPQHKAVRALSQGRSKVSTGTHSFKGPCLTKKTVTHAGGVL
jgi:hypothetical protein